MHKLISLILLIGMALFQGVTLVAQGLTSGTVDRADTDKWREDLRFMAEAMPKYHKNLFHTMTREQFIAAVRDLDRRIPNLARHQIIVELARIVAMVGDGHTNISPTRDPKIGFHILPIKPYFFDDSLYVRAATKEYANLIGASVEQIGNAPATKAYELVKQLIGRDNEMDLRFFAPFLMSMPEVLHAVGLISQPDRATLVLDKNGHKQTVELKSVGLPQLMSPDTDLSWLPQPGWIDARDSAKQPPPLWLRDPQNKFWFEYLRDSQTLYVQLNQIGNKDDESMDYFSKRLLAFIDANSVDRLILDLRLNRGGNGEFNRPILRALIKARKIDQMGKLFVIIGRSTWSAAQFLVNSLEDYTDALFVGEPTGGKRNSYGDSRRIVLPNSGITVRVSTLWWQEDERDRRQWKAPDIAADLKFDDYRNNTDPALKMALEYVPGKSLSELLGEALTANNPKAAEERFKEWRAAPTNRYANGEAQINRLGYELLAKKQFDQAIEVFKLNVAEYPDSSNNFDSLGDAYVARGDMELALKSYKRALELDPTNASARDALERLRGQMQAGTKP
jgi:tetratricopeptide (TPR) repeat protein